MVLKAVRLEIDLMLNEIEYEVSELLEIARIELNSTVN